MFHCFPIFSPLFYVIFPHFFLVPHRSLNFTWHHFTLSLFFPPFFLAFLCDQFILPFHQFFQCFAMVLLDFSSVSNACPNAPSTITTVAPYKRFCSFLPWFFSVLLLHSGHTSKLQFFHCFSIVSRVLYAIMVPHRSLNFTWSHIETAIFPLLFHCFTRALRDNGPTSEPQFYLASFYPLPILSTVLPRVFVRSIYPSISSIFPVFCHGVTRFLQCV